MSMSSRSRRHTFFFATLLLIPTAFLIGQQRGDRAKIKQQQQEQKEDYYKKWLETDVVYIITEEEHEVFLNLSSDEERDQFIEQFWRRRDTDTRTALNEFQDEHYRRIAYANDHFEAGIPGWRTDRGRIYVMYGPPDRKERYPMGGRYERKPHEGGGITSIYPTEFWEYRHIEGLGSDIELEFVDPKGGGLYHLTMDSQEKDEFLRVPGMGLTYAEQEFGQKYWERVVGIRPGGTGDRQGLLFERQKDSPFEKMSLMSKLTKAPVIRYTDLQQVVQTQIHYQELPFDVATHFLQIDSNQFLVSVTIGLDNKEISLEQSGGQWQSRLQVYGQVAGMTGRVAFEFDDDIIAGYPSQEAAQLSSSSYQRKLVLSPGIYKLNLVARDSVSEKLGTKALRVRVPAASSNALASSSLILTKSIEPWNGGLAEPYALGPYKLKPNVGGVFSQGESLGFFFEVYNFQVDQASSQPSLEIRCGIVKPGSEGAQFRNLTRGVSFAQDRVRVVRLLRLEDLKQGDHQLACTINDQISGQSLRTSEKFQIR